MVTEPRKVPPPPEDEFLVDMLNVPVEKLFVDRRYQRGMKKTQVKRLVEGWSWKRYIPIIVVHRKEGDRYAVVDGQQRSLAAEELGIPYLPAVLIVARTLEDEAERFVGANTGVTVGAGDRFRAEYLRQEPRYMEIASQIKLSGFILACIAPDEEHAHATANRPYTIEAVHTIENLYDKGMLVRVLLMISQVWGSEPTNDMVQGSFLDGVYLALKHLDRFEVPQEELVASLQGMGVREIVDRGYERYKSMVTSRSIPGGIAAVLVERFNYRKPAHKSVPPYDRSGARSTRAYWSQKTMSEQPGFEPFGGNPGYGQWMKTEEGRAWAREQAAARPREGGAWARRAGPVVRKKAAG